MNRAIKFRVWEKTKKIMYQPSLNMFVDSLMGTAFWQFGLNQPEPMSDTVVMQFTGLLDKSGKEIYEGDIVKQVSLSNTFEVSWADFPTGFAPFCHSEPGGTEYLPEDFEVIGNVFEHEHLLKTQP